MTDQEIIDSTICRFKIIHQVSLKMAALDVVNGLRKCEHKNKRHGRGNSIGGV